MATVSKSIADRVIAGEFPEDDARKIVEYDDAFGGVAYGVIFGNDDPDKYCESVFVRNPRLYWEKSKPSF